MAGLTNAESANALDLLFTTGDYVAYSSNGTSEASGVVARTAVTSWGAATVADPAVKSNSVALTSAAATGSATITHFAVFSAASAGTQRTDWTALAASKTVSEGDTLTWPPGSLQVTLT